MPRLLHLTDPHLKPHPTDTLVGIYPDLNLQAVLEQAHRDSGPFDLILITGDLAQDPCPASYQRLSELLSSYPCPTLCLPGNHDDLALMRDILNQAPVSCVSPMTLAGWQIVCINTQKPQASQGWVSPAEMAHLRAALHTKQPTLIAMHHHCLSTGSSWMDRMKIENAESLLTVLAAHRHVKLVLHGHVHQPLHWWYEHITLLSTPSTAVQFAPMATAFKVTAQPPAYRVIELDEQGDFQTYCHYLNSWEHMPELTGRAY